MTKYSYILVLVPRQIGRPGGEFDTARMPELIKQSLGQEISFAIENAAKLTEVPVFYICLSSMNLDAIDTVNQVKIFVNNMSSIFSLAEPPGLVLIPEGDPPLHKEFVKGLAQLLSDLAEIDIAIVGCKDPSSVYYSCEEAISSAIGVGASKYHILNILSTGIGGVRLATNET